MKSIFKRGICIAISVLIMSTVVSTNVFALDENVGDSMIINNYLDLKFFQERVRKGNTKLNAELGADIFMDLEPNWEPIGTTLRPYSGKFDGANFSIYYLRCDGKDSGGFFGGHR